MSAGLVSKWTTARLLETPWNTLDSLTRLTKVYESHLLTKVERLIATKPRLDMVQR